ncbi:MAG TPA: SPOR domain-containing protein [Telluria sp.]
MLRFVFWTLLFLNAALFAYGQGYFGTPPNEHEPERLKRQFNTARMTMLSNEQADAMAQKSAAANAASTASTADAASAPAAAAASATAAPATAPATPTVACTEVGTFDAGEARRFEARLAPLDLDGKQSRQAQQEQDVSSWLVHIPPQGSKDAAEHKANELRNLGVTDFYILQGDSPMKWAISLGVFKTESGAQARLAQLNKQGVRTARIAPRGPQTTVYSYRFRDIPEATRAKIAAAADTIASAQAHSCR